MADFMIFMHGDAPRAPDAAAWGPYFKRLRDLGVFDGGSAIGGGAVYRKGGTPAPLSNQLTGYIRVQAESLDQARGLIEGNPVFEAGGSVEIRELPRGA
ncbi:MAG TPA: hypothetical protein VGL66_18230 [Caulobacteraceae bacterium]|jgi:hypothetical protein